MPIRTSLESRVASRHEKDSEASSSCNNAVVASLQDRSPDPFSSLALSPDRSHAIVAGKDTLQLIKIDPTGLRSIRSMKIAHHFNVNDPSAAIGKSGNAPRRYADVRDAFQLGASSSTSRGAPITQLGNITITKVAWSHAMDFSNIMTTAPGASGMIAEKKTPFPNQLQQQEQDQITTDEKDSFVAVAASNGVVVIWDAKQLLFSKPAKALATGSRGQGRSSGKFANPQFHQQPEGIISKHVRAVNSLAWHSKRAGLLLTASQDGSVKLWERKLVGLRKPDGTKQHRRPWYSVGGKGTEKSGGPGDGDETHIRKYSWNLKASFEPKSEAVRDIQWSPFLDDIFALVTASGSLIVYSMHVSVRAMAKIAAHTGDATSLDWHPTQPFDIATGGSGDRTVKIWNLQSALDLFSKDVQDQSSISANSNTWKSDISTTSQSSSETDKSATSSSYGPGYNTMRSSSGYSSGRAKSSSSPLSRYVLSISASVTQVRWRPPSIEFVSVKGKDEGDSDAEEEKVDPHASMLAVATAKLTSAGGSGVLSMWSFHRPFMALSVLEGHREGAVADFVWLPSPIKIPNECGIISENKSKHGASTMHLASDSKVANAALNPSDSSLFRPSGRGGERSSSKMNVDGTNNTDGEEFEASRLVRVWQHVLSVGRDGRCILQSFARGDRPISRVASSCFAMANLSPFQQGYGSLQCFSAYQAVPNRPEDDFALTYLRQDHYTANAPGVFQEEDLQLGDASINALRNFAGQRLPSTVPELIFSVVDQGDLDEDDLPANPATDMVCVAPEVVHLSRFSSNYKIYPDDECPNRVDLCLHNSKVAEDLSFWQVARMWKTVARLLQNAGLDELPPKPFMKTTNVFEMAIFPTIRNLLLERAEAGDVQTCVSLCEVLQVMETGGKVRIPDLSIQLIREWYLSYIDLLHQMCLFSAATFLIKNCLDEVISALNQQSTTIHQSCPRCGKPLQHTTDSSGGTDGAKQVTSSARQACKNCRRRVGMCFLCHQPVQGMFVWCPGCGHGGHLEHALQWFGGGQGGKGVREVCPTGCGHRCNLVQMVSAFPRTDSFVCLPLPPGPSEFPISTAGETPRNAN